MKKPSTISETISIPIIPSLKIVLRINQHSVINDSEKSLF